MRYCTYTQYDCEDVKVLPPDATQLPDGWDEYVWQEASSEADAIANHHIRMDEWHADLRDNIPEKATYGPLAQ